MRRIGFTTPDLFALGFIAWAALSLLWTPNQGEGALHLQNIVSVFLIYLVASRFDISKFACGGVALTFLFVGILLFQLPHDYYGGFGNRNFIAEYLIIGLPFAAVAFRETPAKYVAWGLCLGALVYLFAYNVSHIKFLVLITFGLSIALLAWWRKMYITAAFVILGPIDALVFFGVDAAWFSSVRVRIESSVDTIIMWLDKPYFGHGIGSFNSVYPIYQEAHLQYFPMMGTLLQPITMYLGTAHNEYLQILAEYGVVGFVLVSGFAVSLMLTHFRRVKRTPEQWAALVSFVAIASCSLVGFPLQNPATAILAALAFAFMSSGAPVLSFNINRFIPLPAVAAVIAVFAVSGAFYMRSQQYFSQSRLAMSQGHVADSFVMNFRAVQTFPYDWLPRYQLGLSLAALAMNDERSKIDPRAGDSIFKLSSSGAPNAPGLLVARVYYLLKTNQLDKSDEIETTLEWLKQHASLQAPVWAADAWFAASTGDEVRMRESAYRGSIVIQAENPGENPFLAAHKVKP